jgi:ABC-2 type transport system ATP-binding protein
MAYIHKPASPIIDVVNLSHQYHIHNPSVLFLDEPSVGLDPMARKFIWQYIYAWRQHYGTTILMTTHDMDEADQLCDIVAIMQMKL